MPKPSLIRSWKNTSEFPDAWARPCIEWLMERSGRTIPADFEIRRGVRYDGSGRAGGNHVFMRIRRRDFRADWTDNRYSWDKQREVRTPFEAFVFLAAHEIHHITPHGQREMRIMRRSAYEFRANNAGSEAVEAYRVWAASVLWRKYRRTRRSERDRKRARDEKRAPKHETTAERIAALELRRAAWETKARRAATAIKKLNRRIAGIRAAEKRFAKMAAKS